MESNLRSERFLNSPRTTWCRTSTLRRWPTLALVRLGHNAETLVVRGSPSALQLCTVHAMAAAPFPPLLEAMPGAAYDYGPERLARDELACATRPGRLHFFKRERPVLLFLLHVKRSSHELYTVLSSNLPTWIINAEGGDEGGMRIREVRICRNCSTVAVIYTPVESEAVDYLVTSTSPLCEVCLRASLGLD